MHNIIPRMLIILFIPLAVYMIYTATNWGLADVYYRPAMNQLKNWRSGKIELENNDWSKLQISLSRALSLDQINPEVHEISALALEGPFSNIVPKNTEASDSREQALEHYRQSTMLRPTWPYSWSKLAAVKYRLGEIDDEFFAALHNAERLGKWEPGIQRTIIEMGLINWFVFPESERSFISNTMVNALEKQPKVAMKIINNFSNVKIICSLTKENTEVINFCNKYQELNKK